MPVRHFTDDDYGLVIRKDYVLLCLKYIASDGTVKTKQPTWRYHTESGLQTALIHAKAQRAKLLKLPEFKAYIAKVAANPSGAIRTRAIRTHRGIEDNVVPGLMRVYPSVTRRKLKDGEIREYLSISAFVPTGMSEPYQQRAWSVSKFGLSDALHRAAKWQTLALGTEMPNPLVMAKAEAFLRRRYANMLSGRTDLRSRSRS
ncbi:MAG: hypothetical protein V7693_16025 [Halopseudomonas sabulinigri]